ncbi:MAG: hypothetical protein RLZZ501_1777 [Pseudomonadota bacterium]|jgi:predicted ABC-type ATPase
MQTGRPFILVLAGVNGAGKSSVGGSALLSVGLDWFNPDSVARRIIAKAGLSREQANALAWRLGVRMLGRAVSNLENFAFETTLGGNTLPSLLAAAARTHDIKIWYCGLATVEMHIDRVAQRVRAGGHDIPVAKIRERWEKSRAHLIDLLPHLTFLQVFDNSATIPLGEALPDPRLILEMSSQGVTVPACRDEPVIAWARPIVAAAFAQWDRAGATPDH